jgi:CRP-like cAMP-binding protein
MYVLEKGRVEVLRDWNGTRCTLRELGVGDCFGEMALMDCSLRSATVKAKQDSAAIEITAKQLAEIYDEFPEQYTLIQMNIGREVVRRLRENDERVFAVSPDEHAVTID